MNKEKALRAMKNLRGKVPDEAHREADSILCQVLKKEGYDELVEEFWMLNKWYS